MKSSELLRLKLENAKRKHKQDKAEVKELFNKIDHQLEKYKELTN